MKLRRLLAALLVLVLVITSSPVVYATTGGEGGQEGSGEENPIMPIADPEYTSISAVNTDYMVWSKYVKNTGSQLERDGTDGRTHMIADMPYVDSLLSDAAGEFNKSGEEWVWFAYKVTAPSAGDYTLGLNVTNISNQKGTTGHLIPICVNNKVYTVTCNGKGQSLTTTATLSAGENTVVVFMPMPKNADDAFKGDDNQWKNYTWICVNNILVDNDLTVSAPTAAEVEAVFAPKVEPVDTVVSAVDTSKMLWSANMQSDGTKLGCINQGNVRGDKPLMDALYDAAAGQFNKSGEEWNWFAYKVNVPADGTYTLGVKTNGCKNTSYTIPLCVNNEVHTLTYTAASQQVTTDVTLPAGSHVVVVFSPMPANQTAVTGTSNVDYPWCDFGAVIVDYELTTSKPTVAEVEAVFPVRTDTVVSAADSSILLWSANMQSDGTKLGCINQGNVRGDKPLMDALYDAAAGQFNKSGEEWNWFAYKVNVPADGTYTLGVKTNGCKNTSYTIPLCVNNEVHTLTYTAASQQVTTDVTLPAGSHVVVVFAPMPANQTAVTGTSNVDYPWCDFGAVIVDYELTTSKPTVAEVEACFPPKDSVISAVDSNYMLLSETIGKNGNLERTDQAILGADAPSIETLYTDAIGEFNKSGEQWNWFAYKVTVPAAGSYTLGVKTAGSKYASYKMPLCVNGKVHTLTYSAKAQEVSTEVALPAGEHVVVMFMPMPATKADNTNNAWNDYHWCDVESVIVDHALTASKPTVAEVEACFMPSRFSVTDAKFMLWSATVAAGKEGSVDILKCADQAPVRADLPYIDTLMSDVWGEFNASNSEWNWFAYKVSAPAAGSYTLKLKVNGCKFDSYKIPLVVNNEVYTLNYTAKNQEQSVQVSLSAGEHVVVMFMPMPQNAAAAQNNIWNDYPWCNVEAVTLGAGLSVAKKPTAAEVESYFSNYTKVNPGDEKVILFKQFTDKGDTLEDAARTQIQADMPTVESLPNFGNKIGNWPFMSMKVTAAQDGDYTIRLNTAVKSDTASKQVGMLLDGVSGSAPLKIQSGSTSTVTVSVRLTAGDHVLTFFIPMPKTGAGNTGNIWTDYPWINYNSILMEPGLTVSKPVLADIVGNLGTRVEAEDAEYVIYNNYNTTNETNNKASGGKLVGGAWNSTFEQTFAELETWLDAKHNAYVEYAVVAPADGKYEIGVGFLAGSNDKSIAKPYIAVIVNNTTYKAQFTGEWNQVQRVPLTVDLKEGLNIIRCTSVTVDQPIYKKGWINQDFLDLDTRLTPVKHSDVSMEAEDSQFYNKFKVQDGGKDEAASGKGKTGKVLGASDRKYIHGQSMTLDTFLFGQLKQIPYFSVTVDAPQNGYYPITVHMSGDGRLPRGTVGMVVDDTVYTVKYARTSKTTAGGRVDTLVYLTKGEHVLTFTAPMPADATVDANYSYYWCNYDYITLYDGLTFAKRQREPILDPNYIRVEVEDYAMYNLNGDNGHAAGNGYYKVSQSVAEIMKDGIDGSRTPYVELKVNAKEAGPYAIFLGTTYGITAGGLWDEVYGQYVVDVNGKLETKTVKIHKTAASTVSLVWIILEEGENTIRFTHLTSDAQHEGTTWVDFDYIEMPYWVTKGIEFIKPSEKLEAEDASYDGFAEMISKSYSDGAYLGKVNYDTVEELDITHDSLDPADLGGLPHVAYRVFAEKAGTYNLSIGFAAGLTNYPAAEMAQGVKGSFSVVVNGESKQRVDFTLKSANARMARIITVELNEGENEIIVTGTTSEYVIDRKPRNDETYRLVWIDQDYLVLSDGLTSISMTEDVTNIDDSDIDFGQLDSKETSEEVAEDVPATEPVAEAENSFGWIWIVAGIGAACVLFLILLIGKKRRKEEAKA